MKKMLLALACAALFTATAHAAKPADGIWEAQTQAASAAGSVSAAAAGYRFVSICGVLAPNVCPYGSNPIWFGTGANWTLAQCVSAWNVIHNGIFGQYPRVLSSCAVF